MVIHNKYQLLKYNPAINQLDINLENIIHASGYNNRNEFPFVSLLNELYFEVKNIISPECAFIVVPQAVSSLPKGEIAVDGIILKTGKIISSALKEISKSVLFVGTVGKDFDNWLEDKKKENDLLGEYLANLIGSEIAESLAKWIHKKIFEYFGDEELRCSNRYSPGYCGWDVNEQKKIFEFFPKDVCGITLTESALMLPMKSISGIVGIGKNIERKDYPCEVCNVSFCYKNRRSILV
jgi:hypothetical protein